MLTKMNIEKELEQMSLNFRLHSTKCYVLYKSIDCPLLNRENKSCKCSGKGMEHDLEFIQCSCGNVIFLRSDGCIEAGAKSNTLTIDID